MTSSAMAAYQFTSGAGVAGTMGVSKQFNFTAHDQDGSIVGQMHYDDGSAQAVADVTCVSFPASNEAIMVGNVTRGTMGFMPPATIIFHVLDNGSPGSTDLFGNGGHSGLPSAADCMFAAPPDVLTQGNIVVNNGPKLLALGWPWP
jgi:hypothetical protein